MLLNKSIFNKLLINFLRCWHIKLLLQLDTWFGRPKKAGRGSGTRGYSGSNTMPRPHSGDDINEIEQQRCIIERMDEETVNDRFEEMLVSAHTCVF